MRVFGFFRIYVGSSRWDKAWFRKQLHTSSTKTAPFENHGEAPCTSLQSLMTIGMSLQGLDRRCLSSLIPDRLGLGSSPPPRVRCPAPPQWRVCRHRSLPRLQVHLPRPGQQEEGSRGSAWRARCQRNCLDRWWPRRPLVSGALASTFPVSQNALWDSEQ